MGEARQRDSGVVVEVLVCVGWFLILGLSDLADVWSGDRVVSARARPQTPSAQAHKSLLP